MPAQSKTRQRDITTHKPPIPVRKRSQSSTVNGRLTLPAAPRELEKLKKLKASHVYALGGVKNAQVQAFIEKYKIVIIERLKISLTLPVGASVLSLIKDVHDLSCQLHEKDAVYREQISFRFGKIPEKVLHTSATKPLKIMIYGNVADSTLKDLNEQIALLKSLGLKIPKIEHLAAAHAAYFIVTGEDLFDHHLVRARGGTGALGFHCDEKGWELGVFVSQCHVPKSYVAVSATLLKRMKIYL